MKEKYKNKLFDRIKKVIKNKLGVDESKITEDCSFTDDLDADSLDMIDLALALEDEFGIEIPEEKIRTVEDLIKYLKLKEVK